MTIHPDETVKDVKDRLEDSKGVPAKQQRLLYDDTPLSDDDKPVSDYNIPNDSKLDLTTSISTVYPKNKSDVFSQLSHQSKSRFSSNYILCKSSST